MHYTKEQKLDIGRRIYDGELTRFQAADEYGIHENTARTYMRLYRDTNNLPHKTPGRKKSYSNKDIQTNAIPYGIDKATLESYESMSKEELVKELIKARIAEARLKKGYEVKGDGSIIQYVSKNTK